MKAIYFPTANKVFREGTPDEFFIHETPDGDTICCFELSKEEIEEIQKTGRIWLTRHTLGKVPNPIYPYIDNPFENKFVECGCGNLDFEDESAVDTDGKYTCSRCIEKLTKKQTK